MIHAAPSHKARVWEELKLEDISIRLLALLIRDAYDPYRLDAIRELARRFPEKSDLLLGALNMAAEFAPRPMLPDSLYYSKGGALWMSEDLD